MSEAETQRQIEAGWEAEAMTGDLGRIMEQEMAATQRALLDDLNELALINETMKPVEARKRILTDRIKQGMGLAGLDELADGETGVVGRIQERAGTPLYDLVSVSEKPALLFAARAGMLRLDHQMFDRFTKQNGAAWADELARTRMPGTATSALIVSKGEK